MKNLHSLYKRSDLKLSKQILSSPHLGRNRESIGASVGKPSIETPDVAFVENKKVPDKLYQNYIIVPMLHNLIKNHGSQNKMKELLHTPRKRFVLQLPSMKRLNNLLLELQLLLEILFKKM